MKNLIPILLLAFSACSGVGEKKANKGDSKRDSLARKDSLHFAALKVFSDKHAIKYSWDSLTYKYTLDYDKVIASTNQIIYHYTILDIFKREDKFFTVVRVEGDMDDAFIFTLETDEKYLKILQSPELVEEFEDSKWPLLVSITSIKKLSISLDVEKVGECKISDGEIEDNAYCQMGVYNSVEFVGFGKLISIQNL